MRAVSTHPRTARGRGRRTPGRVLSPALLALLVVGCSSGATLEEWTLELRSDVVIGGQSADAQSAFYEPTDLGVDGRGRVYVLDSGNSRVQVFEPDGAYLRTLGRSGEGPGDLRRPEGLWVYPDGEVVVADTGNRRLQPYGASGEPLSPIGLDHLPMDVVGTADGFWVLRLPSPTFVLGPDPEPLVHKLDPSGAPLGTAVSPAAADVGILYFLVNALRIASAPDDGFAIVDTHVNSRIRRHDRQGAPVAEIPVLYKADAWAPLGRLPEVLSNASIAAVARTASDLGWDPVRRIYWVLSGYVDRLRTGEWVTGRELYRYRPDGTYQGSVMLPFTAQRVCLSPDGAVWLLDADSAVHRMILEDPETVRAAGR